MADAEVAAAVVSVVEVPCLVWLDEFAAAAAGDTPGRDERLELSTPGNVGVGVAAEMPAWLSLLPHRGLPEPTAPLIEPGPTGR